MNEKWVANLNRILETVAVAAVGGVLALFVAYAFFGFHPIQSDHIDRGRASINDAPVAPVISIPRPAPAEAPERPEPRTISKTVAFMPGQYVDLPNRRFRKVEIHSTFPLRVVSGDCHENYSVEFICDADPSDIFITDMRRPPIFRAPQGNMVTITLTEF
jgi:hypothetical protein